ncbi:MAG: DUF2771 family protein [Nocardia sp.]|nr:DUF2771 family protein [Nocardia sp.]
MTKFSTRTILAMVVAAVAVVIVATVAIVAVAVHNAPAPTPVITAYAHGTTATAPLYRDCAIGKPDPQGRVSLDCHESGAFAKLNPPLGAPVQLSFPKELSTAPWVMVQEFEVIGHPGETTQHMVAWKDYPEGTQAIRVDTHPAPNLRLIGLEVQLLIITGDGTGREAGYLPFRTWSIKTTT